MEIYILKSAACLAVFLVFYKLFLERENMHLLKRCYLLGSLVGAIVIPLITFIDYVEIPQIFNTVDYEFDNAISAEVLEKPTNYIPIILWSIYGLGVLFFSIKFSKNLIDLFKKVKNNIIVEQHTFKNVLLNVRVVPHTFMSYIFLNKTKFERGNIPQEVLLHEQAHARQRHSFDVLFIELLQIVFWFNPLIYIFKQSIKLNHEFLADEAVLKNGVETSSYQKILLAFSSSAQTPILANSINYSSIKKRFTVMKTQTSRKAIWLRTTLLLPLFAVLIYGFSSTETIYTESSSEENLQQTITTAENIIIQLRSDRIVSVNEIPATLATLPEILRKFNSDLSKEERNEMVKLTIESANPVRMSLVYEIRPISKEYGVTKIYVPGSIFDDVSGSDKVLKTPEMGIDLESPEQISKGEKQTEATKEEVAEYQKLVDRYNTTKRVRLEDVTRMMEIYKKMSPEQKNGNALPNLPPPPPASPIIKKGENSNIPPPPPPPTKNGPDHGIYVFVSGETIYVNGKLSNLSNFKSEINKVTSNWPEAYFKKWGVNINTDRVENDFINKINQEYKKTNIGKRSKGDVQFIPMKLKNIPPPPPPPISPLEHIKELAKDDAIFYLEGKKITSNEAIEFVMQNKNLSICTNVEGAKPVVELSGTENKKSSKL